MTTMTKWLFRLLVLPTVFVLTILEWVGTYILNLSEMFCRLIIGLTAMLAVAAYWIGVASIKQAANFLFAGLAFFGKLPGKSKTTGIIFLIASAVFGLCELCCIWESPKGLYLIIGGILLVNLVFTVARNEGEQDN